MYAVTVTAQNTFVHLTCQQLTENWKSNKVCSLKARSDDPFLRIRFLVPKTGSRRSDGPIPRFRFCDENVGRSSVVCSHDPFFRTNKEPSIWRQNDQAKFVGAFHLSRRASDENRACSFSIRFFKIKDPFDGRSFLMCSRDPFFGTNKNRILKNGSCERALNWLSHIRTPTIVPPFSLLLISAARSSISFEEDCVKIFQSLLKSIQ